MIRSVIDHQLRDDAQPALVRRAEKRLEIGERAIVRINIVVIRDVVAIIAQGGGVKREQPDRGHAKLLEIIELADQAPEIAHSVAGAVLESLYVQLVDDRVLVPKRVGSEQIIEHLLKFAKKLTRAIWRSIRGMEFSRQQYLLADLDGSDDGSVIASWVSAAGFTGPKHLLANKLGPDGALQWGDMHVAVFDGGSLQFWGISPLS